MSLSSRYIPDRFLPDKAIDVMDEAGSRVRMENHAARRVAAQGRLHLMEWEQLIEVLDAKDQAIQVSKSPAFTGFCSQRDWLPFAKDKTSACNASSFD